MLEKESGMELIPKAKRREQVVLSETVRFGKKYALSIIGTMR
jgi:hypothetical protein